MKELENIQDRIDEYIRGTMSDKDRAIFEDELCQDADLRHEVEVQVSIADAVQAVHLKQMLQGVEAEITLDKEETTSKSITPNVYWRRFYQWAAAAAAVAIIFFSGNMWRQTSRIKGFGNDYYASLVAPSARDGNSLDSLMALAYSHIGNGEFDAAESVLNEANSLIDEGLAVPVIDEETDYEHRLLELKQYDAQWYRALIIMKQGKYRKAKEILKEIAQDNGPYASDAKEILDKMFNVKL